MKTEWKNANDKIFNILQEIIPDGLLDYPISDLTLSLSTDAPATITIKRILSDVDVELPSQDAVDKIKQTFELTEITSNKNDNR